MQLKDTKVSIVLEMDEPEGTEDVMLSSTGDTGPNGSPMYKVIGKYPNVVEWLSSVYGLVNEDILVDYIPSFRLEDLIP